MRAKSADLIRCSWPSNPLSIRYHDEEWGVPLHDDRVLFEFLILEGAQAGLSWETILQKRENYRAAFDDFDPQRIARYDAEAADLLRNPGIIRNRLKIASAVKNAKAFLAVQKEFGTFDAYIWQFVGGRPRMNAGARSRRFRPHRRVRRHEQGPEAPRLQLRRLDDLLRLHASRGHGERSQRRVLPLCPAQFARTPAFSTINTWTRTPRPGGRAKLAWVSGGRDEEKHPGGAKKQAGLARPGRARAPAPTWNAERSI